MSLLSLTKAILSEGNYLQNCISFENYSSLIDQKKYFDVWCFNDELINKKAEIIKEINNSIQSEIFKAIPK